MHAKHFLVLLLLSCSMNMLFACSESDTEEQGQADTDIVDSITDGDNDAEADIEMDTDLAEEDRSETDNTEISELEIEEETDTFEYVFEAFEWLDEEPDVTERICTEAADPDAAPDKIFIDCLIEGESFVDEEPEPKNELIVMAYNIERGYHIDSQISAILDSPLLPIPDVILVSEADRGCSRTGRRHVLREYAQALGMNYVYAVEFVELPRDGGSGGTIGEMCEHGNGILSRYPIGNVRAIRHAEQRNWYENEGEPRLGGRVAVTGDIKVGDRYLHLYAIHFESDIGEDYRSVQAEEVLEDSLSRPFVSIIGGDFNSGYYIFDMTLGTTQDHTIKPFLDAGYIDSHAGLDPENRVTAPSSGFLLDLLIGSEDVFSDPAICPEENCGEFSDHLPVWATVNLAR